MKKIIISILSTLLGMAGVVMLFTNLWPIGVAAILTGLYNFIMAPHIDIPDIDVKKQTDDQE